MFGIFVFFFKTCRQYNPKVKARNKNLTFLLFCFVLFLITHWLYFSSSLSHLTIPLYFLTLSSLSTFHQLSLSCLTFLIFSPLFSLHFLLHYFIAPLFIPFSHSTFLLHFPCSTFLFYFLSPFSYPTFSLLLPPFITPLSHSKFSNHFLSSLSFFQLSLFSLSNSHSTFSFRFLTTTFFPHFQSSFSISSSTFLLYYVSHFFLLYSLYTFPLYVLSPLSHSTFSIHFLSTFAYQLFVHFLAIYLL